MKLKPLKISFLMLALCLLSIFFGCSLSPNNLSENGLQGLSMEQEVTVVSQTEESGTAPLLDEPPANELTVDEEPVEIEFDTETDLDSWIGQYKYLEYTPKISYDKLVDFYSVYLLDINKSVMSGGAPRGVYYANFAASGWMLDLNAITIIQGDSEEIAVVFYDYLPNGKGLAYGQLKRGDILFTLRRTEAGFQAEWGAIDLSYQEKDIFEKVM